MPNNFRATPLMIGGVLYSPNGVGLVEAFTLAPAKRSGFRNLQPSPKGCVATVRGAWDTGETVPTSDSFVQRGDTLIALNTKTGQPYPEFGVAGVVNLRYGGGEQDELLMERLAPGVPGRRHRWVHDERLAPAQGATPGDVRAYDVRTGKLRWTFHVVPRKGEPGVETWKENSWQYHGHSNLWSLISADEELGYAYLPLTSPTSDMYGGHRVGDNLFSDTLVCVECQTGKRVWHYQLVRHDLWDTTSRQRPFWLTLRSRVGRSSRWCS